MSTKLRVATLVILTRKSGSKITEVCLAMKKRGFGMGRWNGVGGKVDSLKETVEEAAKRETKEEIDVVVNKLHKVAEISFYFQHNPDWDQIVHGYFTEKWAGDIKETEEMAPRWFKLKEIPYKNMWPDDNYWLPLALKGKLLKATFIFGENDTIQDKKIVIVSKL